MHTGKLIEDIAQFGVGLGAVYMRLKLRKKVISLYLVDRFHFQ